MQPMSYPSSSESIAEKVAQAFTNGGAPLSDVSSLSDAPPRSCSRPGRVESAGFGCACSAEDADARTLTTNSTAAFICRRRGRPAGEQRGRGATADDPDLLCPCACADRAAPPIHNMAPACNSNWLMGAGWVG